MCGSMGKKKKKMKYKDGGEVKGMMGGGMVKYGKGGAVDAKNKGREIDTKGQGAQVKPNFFSGVY
jgi:hypothetical protein